MENFFQYEELGRGSSSIVYKGRERGTLNYIAIICADKSKRPEITNHVRLCHNLDHPSIVRFYEWYMTSKHLWMIVELCSGGSLESLILDDKGLSEDTVREFGLDVVRGLEHIHKSGIIFSDLTPAKILLDGSGRLKFSNFSRAKAVGDTEDFYVSLSKCDWGTNGDCKETFDAFKKRFQGSPVYTAPEVFQGAETSVASDLWALGCVLYYMYTGKPPFYSEHYAEIRKMILQQEPPAPKQTVFPDSRPSKEFLKLLRGLLQKNPKKRLTWPEIINHPFWTRKRTEENLGDGKEKMEKSSQRLTKTAEVPQSRGQADQASNSTVVHSADSQC
ncbi:serine/threonine-protein kinase ULK4 isoform 1-T2 [Synchiropus picturatus]